MGDSYKFYKECKKHEIKPILGQEFYLCDDRNEKGGNIYHLMVIAKNNNGYKNLCKLSSEAYINYFYKKPRIDFDLLYQYKDDLIVTTACMSNNIARMITAEETDKAIIEIDRYKKVFGDDFYLEVHNHNIEEEIAIRDFYRTIGIEKGIKRVVGTDVHYTKKEDKYIHNIFKQLAYNTVGKSNDDAFSGDGYHLFNYKELQERFLQDEIDTTLEIADKCNVNFEFTGYKIPKFKFEDKTKDSFEFLKDMCVNGLKKRGLYNDIYSARLDYELEQIHLANLEDYVLIVADYCNWCKNNGIAVGPGRGSVGNSIMAIASGISEVDSVKYDLDFVRFTNKGRVLTYDFGV